MLPRLAATIRASLAAIRADLAPPTERYCFPLDLGAVFRWSLGSLLADDGFTTVVPTGGSNYFGTWTRVRTPDLGANITAATATLAVGGKRCRRIPVATLTANLTLTLLTTNAEAGDWIEIPRSDVGAFTVAIVNGGPAAGTLVTLPISVRSYARIDFDGTDFFVRDSHLML